MSDPANDAPDIAMDDPSDDDQVEVLLEGVDELPSEKPTEPEEEELPPEYKKMTKKEIIAKLQEVSKTSETDKDIRESLSKSIESLGEKLQPVQIPPQTPQQPQKSASELEEEIDELAFKKPSEAMSKLFETKYGPILRDQISANQSLQRKLLREGTSTKDFFTEHSTEIDETFKSLPPKDQLSGEGYDKAYREVRSRYTDDIIAQEVTKRVKEELEKIMPTIKQTGSFTETKSGVPSKSVRGPKKIILTRDDQEIADRRGMSYEEYARWKSRNIKK